jgi:5'-3' exoribonuclease 1
MLIARSALAFVSLTPPLKYKHDHDVLNQISNIATPKSCRCSRAESSALFGIPKMFRWLTDQYPNINSRLNEGLGTDKIVDNFYLDMNGIIHPCTHGNSDEIVVLDETAMFKKIFGYVDR